MIEKIELKNFKNFVDFKLDRLKQINLIVGKNNVGKTNLLEALFIGSNPTNLSLFISKLTDRLGLFSPQLLEYFFCDPEKSSWIKINSLESRYDILKEAGEVVGFKSILKEKEYVLRFQKVLNEYSQIQNFSPSSIVEEKFVLKQEPPPKRHPILTMMIAPHQFVNITHILSKLLKKGLRHDILSLFQEVFRQKVENIFFESVPPIIYIETENKILPLSFYGEGTLRIFYIWLLALELYKSFPQNNFTKVILIDEIENGLHFSVKPMVWNLIFKIVRDFKIQFFITTHDEEFFASIFELNNIDQYKEYFQLVRLRKDQTVAYYDCEMLKLIAEKRKKAFEEIWEIRG